MSDSYPLSDINAVVLEEFNKWGLPALGWKFSLNNRNCHLGLCDLSNKIIYLSKNHVQQSSKHSVMDTIRHEISHALHYHHYADNGRLKEFFARHRSGRRWIRNVPPHGREWKQFAVLVGANPSRTSDANLVGTEKWRLVVVHSDDNIEDAKYSCNRFLVRLKNRCLINRKNTTGKLFLVNAKSWDKISNTNGPYTKLIFHQVPPQKGMFTKLTGSQLHYVL